MERRHDLDGLRGLAILLVIGFHAGVPWLRGAFVAVDVFFVLSGFFLATRLSERLATGESIELGQLLGHRIWRLLPALAVVLLATLATTLLYAPIDRAAVARHVIPAAAGVANLVYATQGVNYFHAAENPLLHLWMIGAELQLALSFPLVVIGLAALGERLAGPAMGTERRLMVMRVVMTGVAVLGTASFILAVALNDDAPMWAYFGPHTRLWSFSAGGLMAFLCGGGQSVVGAIRGRIASVQIAGLALLVLPALLYDSAIEYPGVMALAPVGGAALLLATGGLGTTSFAGRVLASRPLVAVGMASYGLYLWHLPLMVLGAVLVPDIGVVGRLAWGGAAFVAAFIANRLLARIDSIVVRPVSRRRPLLVAAVLSGTMGLIATAVARSSDRAVGDSVHRRYAAARNDHFPHRCWSLVDATARGASCTFGAKRAVTTIALFGDSHASHWLGALDRAGKARRWRIEPYVMGGCPVADVRGLISGAAERLHAQCARFVEATLRRLEHERPDAVILSNADLYLQAEPIRIAEATWTEGLRRTYSRLERAGIPVVVMRDIPEVPFDVPSCLSRRAAGLPFATDCRFVPNRTFIASARRAQDRAARGLNVRFVDMNDQVCQAERCPTERGGLVVYSDDDHITGGFSRSVGLVLGDRLAAGRGIP